MRTDEELARKLTTILPILDERQRRLLLAAEARSLGYGGISRVSKASGISRATIQTVEITVCLFCPGDEQVEQDRAPPVLVHHDELARSSAGESPGGRRIDRCDEDRDRAGGRGPTGYEGLSDQGQSHKGD